MRQTFKRDIRALDEIFAFVKKFIAKHQIDDSLAFVINLVIEELFTNLVKYNAGSPHDILIGLEKKKRGLIMTVTDFDVEPFDVTKTEEVDVGKALQERKVGGLGLHLVKQMVDEVHYEHKNGNSIITVIKKLER